MFKNKSLWEMDELRIVIGAMVILAFATGLLVILPYFLLDDLKAPDGLKPYTNEELVGRQVVVEDDKNALCVKKEKLLQKYPLLQWMELGYATGGRIKQQVAAIYDYIELVDSKK